MITIVDGDIFKSGADVICHQVNCRGRMGSGIALSIKYNYPDVYTAYMKQCKNKTTDELLGTVLYVPTNDCLIANMFTQDNYGYDGDLYTNYDMFKKALLDIHDKYSNKHIAFPYKIGCVRGGGNWDIIYGMICDIFRDCNVSICKLDKG